MHLYTDSKAALKEAVMRPSERLSPWELLSAAGGVAWERSKNGTRERAFVAELQRAQAAAKPPQGHRSGRTVLCNRGSETKDRERER
jgi:hypothetical protein